MAPLHYKPKPCKAYRELHVSQFRQGTPCFHNREPLFSMQGPCFHYRDFPVNLCTSLLVDFSATFFFSWELNIPKLLPLFLTLCRPCVGLQRMLEIPQVHFPIGKVYSV